MIDALERALAEIHTSIPHQILEIGFRTNEYMDVSIDERIRSEVINKKVRKDVSVFCGPIQDLILDASWTKLHKKKHKSKRIYLYATVQA